MSATDIDQGANSRLLYHIVDGNHDNAFVIEPPFSGLVKTNIVLDREIRDMYRLTVIATDEGMPQLTGTSTIRINIVDVNDNQPTFPPHSVISITEGQFYFFDMIIQKIILNLNYLGSFQLYIYRSDQGRKEQHVPYLLLIALWFMAIKWIVREMKGLMMFKKFNLF